MTGHEALFAAGAIFAAAFLKGATGLGFATLCLGLLANVFDVKHAIPLVILPSLASNLLVMRDAGGFREGCRRFWPLYVAAVPGLALGLWLLGTVPGHVSRAGLGAVMVAYGLWAMARAVPVLSDRTGRRLAAPVGLATGVINGLTGSQVMPILPYLIALDLGKDGITQIINSSFTFNSLIMLAGLGWLGLLHWDAMLLSAAGVVPVFLGIRLGGRVRRSISETAFRRVVLALLVLIGLNLVLRG